MFRYAGAYILVDPVKRVAVATDSRVLVMAPIHRLNVDTAGGQFLVHGESVRQAFSLKKKIGNLLRPELTVKSEENEVSISINTKQGRLTVNHPQWEAEEKNQKMFPRYEDVIPSEDEKFSLGICLSATLLKKIAEHALYASDGEEPVLRFRFRGCDEAILITLYPSGAANHDKHPPPPIATYVLMPMAPFKCDTPAEQIDDQDD